MQYLAIFFLLVSTTFTGLAQGKFILNDLADKYSLKGRMYIYEDPTGRLDKGKILSKQYQDSFKLDTGGDHYIQNKHSRTWVRLSVKDTSKCGNYWLLELWDFRCQEVILYDSAGGILQRTGYSLPFYFREHKHKNFTFRIYPQKDREVTYYVSMQGGHPFYINGAVKSYAAFMVKALDEYAFLLLFYGIILALFLYNLLIYLTTQNKSILYYSLYLISIFLLATSKDGIGFQYLWGDFPGFNLYLLPMSECAMVCFAGVYAHQFLELKTRIPKLSIIVRAVIGLRLVVFLFLWEMESPALYTQWFDVFPMGLYLYAGIASRAQGFVPARFYILAFSLVFLGFFINVLLYFDLIPLNAFSLYSLNFGVIGELFFLSVAISDAIKNMMLQKQRAQHELIIQIQEKEQLKDKINRELEAKVMERTEELNQKAQELYEANKKLESYSQALLEANSHLDTENWNLNKALVDKKKAIIKDEELSFEEFFQVYPDDAACQRYLEELKWAEGFACKRCGNGHFGEGPKKFTRKCTKCDFIESVTSHTLFHGIKFPLNKAFYLVYITAIAEKKITVTQLSGDLQLRYNTASDFRKKILDRRDLVLAQRQLSKIDKWESLVLD